MSIARINLCNPCQSAFGVRWVKKNRHIGVLWSSQIKAFVLTAVALSKADWPVLRGRTSTARTLRLHAGSTDWGPGRPVAVTMVQLMATSLMGKGAVRVCSIPRVSRPVTVVRVVTDQTRTGNIAHIRTFNALNEIALFFLLTPCEHFIHGTAIPVNKEKMFNFDSDQRSLFC